MQIQKYDGRKKPKQTLESENLGAIHEHRDNVCFQIINNCIFQHFYVFTENPSHYFRDLLRSHKHIDQKIWQK